MKLIVIIWILLLATGVLVKVKSNWIPDNSKNNSIKARTDLHQYQQLSQDDLIITGKTNTFDAVAGKHLLRAKKANEIIETSDVIDFPVINSANSDSVVSVLYLNEEEGLLSKTAQPGNFFLLCSEIDKENTQGICLDSIKLLAIHDSTKLVPRNVWIVLLPRNKADSLSRFMAANSRYILSR